MIKIVTGWSNPGGSTVANLNLVNLFNDYDIPSEVYGPHEWFTTQSKFAKTFDKLYISKNDIIISHAIDLTFDIKPKRWVYSSHETNIFPISKMKLENCQGIHFVSEFQKQWHEDQKPLPKKEITVIPNVVSDFNITPHSETNKIAGVIGSIDSHKQTDIAVKKALEDGCDEVFIFGVITEPKYFYSYVEPLLLNPKVKYKGYVDKNDLYSHINIVYHASKRETFNLVKAECEKIGIPFIDIFDSSPKISWWTNEEIFLAWKSFLRV